ncbi:hypothetical protein JRO89_XS02G0065500 [Xanthoceras sorbifolium]|uniref:Cyclin-dependent kinase inhibitor n=1 Tax=Xanthoceras sorbifolium TaxID=99658 RepID=A0ABQ8IEY0_9ROSI|nr:hypothetical protein JRO89_XS02G0065500 [Xanthoceras sorbifolium]
MEEASSTSLSPKRTKFTSQQLKESKLPSTTNDVVSPPQKTTSSGLFSHKFSTSRCSSNGFHEIVKDSFTFADLEVDSFETEVSTCNNNNSQFSKETSSLSEICGDSEDTSSMDSPPKNQPPESRRRITTEGVKMPSLAEIDEFFSSAEKYEQNRFAEKIRSDAHGAHFSMYNYDVVKDVALEGRYQWVRLKP